jgi:phosphoribosyl 1,2-cyclic phosphate phosphodiesterase
MKVTLLGTGGSAGLPQIGGVDGRGDWGRVDPAEPRNRRSRPSIVIHANDGRNILVDTGPDLRYQLTNCGIGKIDAVIYTHAHADHVAGLDDVRILNRILGMPMPAYATADVWAELRRRFDYVFKPWNGGFFGRPALETHDIAPGLPFELFGQTILPIDQDHGFTRSLGLRIGDFAYCTDVVRLDETALAALKGVKSWVVDCFTPANDHPTHAGLETVQGWVDQLRPQRTILTHMGPAMDYKMLLATLPPGIEPGYDGMELAP